jgi:hypothetical protein
VSLKAADRLASVGMAGAAILAMSIMLGMIGVHLDSVH